MDPARVRKQLLDRLNEIRQETRRPDNIEIPHALKEAGEHAASSIQIDVSIGVDSINQKEAREIILALGRLDKGTYGVCKGCGRPIPEARLIAWQTADQCRDCAEKEDPQFMAKAPLYPSLGHI